MRKLSVIADILVASTGCSNEGMVFVRSGKAVPGASVRHALPGWQ